MAKLVLAGKGISYSISDKPVTIGRSSQCDIVIHDNQSSRKHCEAGKDKEIFYIKDLNSYNGTYLNDKKIHFSPLNSGDKIRIGRTIFQFVLDDTLAVASSDTTSPKPATLIIRIPKQKHQIVNLLQGSYSLGREDTNRILLRDPQVSSKHAEILPYENGWWIYDSQSKNGVFVNNKRVANALLKHGDTITLGETVCIFQYQEQMSKRLYFHAQSNIFRCVVGVVFLILISIALLFATKTFSRVHGIPDNLIDDFSFEDVDVRLSWECNGQIKTTDKSEYIRSGISSLYFSDTNSLSLTSHEAWYWDSIEIPYGKVYQISAWIKHQRLVGAAGLKIAWFQKDSKSNKQNKIGETYSPMLEGVEGQWNKIEFIAYPPPLANQMRIACFTAGRADFVCFDDICLLQSKSIENTFITHGGFQAHIDNRGILEIYKGREIFLSAGKTVVFWHQKDGSRALMATQEFAMGKAEIQPNILRWKGELCSLDSINRPSAEIECKIESDGFSIFYSLTFPSALAEITPEYSLSIPSAYFSNKMEIKGDSASSNSLEKMPPTIQKMVWELPENQKEIGFFYSSPLQCNIVKDSFIHFYHTIPQTSPTRYVFQMKLKTDFLEDINSIQKWESSAQELEKKGCLGQAFLFYQKIAQVSHFHQAVQKANACIKNLRESFSKDVESLSTTLEESRFFGNPRLYLETFEKYQQLPIKWEGYPELEKISQILNKWQVEKAKYDKEQMEKAISILNKQAQDFENEGLFLASMLFYQEIVDRYPDGENTKDILNKIQLLKEKAMKEKVLGE